MIKSDLRIKKTLYLLSSALFELLTEQPFEEIKVNQICEKAMIHRTTFYTHFNDKYDLLEYAITELQKEALKQVDQIDQGDICTFYLTLASIYIQHLIKNQDHYQFLVKDHSGIITDIFMDHMKKNLEIQLAQKEVPINTNIMIDFYVSGTIYAILNWYRKGMKETQEELIASLKFMIA